MKPNNEMFRHFGSMVFLVVLALEPAATPWANATESGTQPPAPSSATLQSSYGKLPLSFEANHGQWDASVQFVTRGGGHTLFLTPSEAVLTLRTGGTKNQERRIDATPRKTLSSPSPSSYSAVRMRFKGTDSQAEMVGLEPLPGIVNYFIGDDPAKWRTNIPTYQKVEYKNLYAGIDLVNYGNQGHLEYDLVVAPGADPTQIRLAFDGAEQIAVDDQGDLVLTLSQSSAETAAPILRLYKPVVYQRDEQGQKHLLASSYVVRSSETATTHAKHAFWTAGENSHVTFQVASYDASKPLIIDPVLSWATYLGGNLEDFGGGIAVDQAGQAYVTGTTLSSNFPGTAGSSLQSTFGGGPSDAFVIKLNALGTAIIYSIYLGGSGIEEGRGITVDTAGNAYVTGDTGSSDFPGTAGSPIQSVYGGGDAFITKLNAAGTGLVYSTYLGGSGVDQASKIAVDLAGNAYVAGNTSSLNFPGTVGSPIQNTKSGGNDAFVAKITSSTLFTAFDVRAKIDVHDRGHHGRGSHHRPHHDDAESRDYQRQDDDEFKLVATFTLGPGSNGIDPLKEAVMIQVGTFSTAIPAGSFKQHKGRFVFEGMINGVHLEAVLRSLILGNDYELKVEGHGADLTGTVNPVPVSVTIGDDSGNKAITAKIK